MNPLPPRDANGELAPERFRIAHDDYHARHVGRTADGRQFFVTTPFVWASSPGGGAEYAARYLFDDDGALVEATIVPVGGRDGDGDGALPGNVTAFPAQQSAVDLLLTEVGPVTYGDITIAPFSIVQDGVEFGLVLNGPDDDEDEDDEWYWNVTIEPGDYMAFSSPWDSGDYDT